ncbi:hypothetical protein GCM10010368_25980 [Streptomyces roseiscleroticus]|uniref:GH16 domain-containing protein n=1 Tax=Streptomyces roseiscleroticus TaxID=1972 RepID=A0ABN3EHM0_9ACTN
MSATALCVSPALAAPTTEEWAGTSPYFHISNAAGGTAAVTSVDGANDGRAMELRLNGRPAAGPGGGVEIASNTTYQYGTFGTRIKTADCSGQGRVGVVTGTFTYSTDHSDANGNGLPDNDEIDIEVLCAQPNVLWLTIYTDYDDATGRTRKISRAIDMPTGKVLYNCFTTQLGGECEPLLPNENTPASVTPVPNFNSSKQFHTFMFDWQPNSVTFWTEGANGEKNVLWDYRGPSDRIPKKPSLFLQNVWHTDAWDPLDGPAHAQPQSNVSAFVDSTTLPR